MTTTAEPAKTLTADDMRDAEQVERANAIRQTRSCSSTACGCCRAAGTAGRTVFEEAGYIALDAGLARRSEHGREANAHPEVFADKSVGEVADHSRAIIGRLDAKPVIIGHSFGGLLTQILAGRGLAAASVAIDPAPFRGVLPLPISALRSASPVLATRPTRPCGAAHLRAVPLRVRQRGRRGRGAGAVRDVRRARPGRAALPGGAANLNPWTEVKVDTQEPRARSAADHLRREGPHRPVGDRQRVVQAPEAQRGRDRDRRDAGPRPRARRSTAAGARSPTPRSRSSSGSPRARPPGRGRRTRAVRRSPPGRPWPAGGSGWRCRTGRGCPCRCRRSGRSAPG